MYGKKNMLIKGLYIKRTDNLDVLDQKLFHSIISQTLDMKFFSQSTIQFN